MSALSGRILTAYVPLRSATERKRAAFLTPAEAAGNILSPNAGYGDYSYPIRGCGGGISKIIPTPTYGTQYSWAY